MAENKHERLASSAIQSVLSFGLMFAVLYATVYAYPKELAWFPRNTLDMWKSIRGWLQASFLDDFHMGQVLLNHLRLINGPHIVTMLFCTVAVAPFVGALFSRTRSSIGRMVTTALTSVAGVSVGTMFLLLNLSNPKTLGVMLDFCEWLWHALINFIEVTLGGFALVQGLVNFARTGINGHHMLLITIATFICGWGIRKVWDMFFPRITVQKKIVVPPPPPQSGNPRPPTRGLMDSPIQRVLRRKHR